jgi:2-polyprenyl-3-methyl-5-hydroxy-6-metoxy-1,4-benzoquinol methylase
VNYRGDVTEPDTDTALGEIQAGERFAFGENWTAFLQLVDEQRIAAATRALADMLGPDLTGLSFVDVGSGSGLSSLAAYRLGARVLSFDFDPQSVACTAELRRRYGSEERWSVVQGSVLDPEFLAGLGRFDVVYSWGVLHHTGDMWRALEAVVPLVAPGGRLFIAVYNDQGLVSAGWTAVKKAYVSSGPVARRAIEAATSAYFGAVGLVARAGRAALRRPAAPAEPRPRGMDRRRDLVDWVGGYPFEVARPDQVFAFYRERGFVLDRLVSVRGLACNEYVFSLPAGA